MRERAAIDGRIALTAAANGSKANAVTTNAEPLMIKDRPGEIYYQNCFSYFLGPMTAQVMERYLESNAKDSLAEKLWRSIPESTPPPDDDPFRPVWTKARLLPRIMKSDTFKSMNEFEKALIRHNTNPFKWPLPKGSDARIRKMAEEGRRHIVIGNREKIDAIKDDVGERQRGEAIYRNTSSKGEKDVEYHPNTLSENWPKTKVWRGGHARGGKFYPDCRKISTEGFVRSEEIWKWTGEYDKDGMTVYRDARTASASERFRWHCLRSRPQPRTRDEQLRRRLPLMIGIDQFAGAGGCTTGATLAGHEVTWAGNHDQLAIAAHEANHPNTTHVCEDLIGYNYYDMEDFDFMMSSPSCQGHSTASQAKRRRYHEKLRAVAWGAVHCLDVKMPEWAFIENVPNFRRWKLLDAWKHAIRSLGYNLQEHKLLATNHGVPQLRNRIFFVARLGEIPTIEFDKPEYVPNFLDIMEETDEGWTEVKDACKGDKVRIKAGREKCGRTFLSQQTTGHRGVPLDEPIRTITTQDHWKVVDGDSQRRLTITELKRCMGFPDDYILPDCSRTKQIQLLGNAVCPPVMRDILQQTLSE